ncbi:MAG: OmpA family protein [Niabella sp.]
MSFNIVDLVKNYVSQDLIAKASSFLGESEGGVSKAVSGLIPSILGGIVSKGTETEAGAQQILDSATEAKHTGILGNLGSLFGNADLLSKGTGLFNSLFGGSSNTIVDTISNFAGIKSNSSGSLISLLTPLVLGLLGKHAEDNNLSAGGFSSFLSSQKNNILNALPSGLGSIGSLLGLGSIGAAARETVSDVKHTAATTYNYAETQAEKAGGGTKWLLPLLLLAALVFLLWWLMGNKGCNKGEGTPGTDTTATAPADTTAVAPAAVDTTATAARALTKVVLPSGKEIEAYPGGVEDQLVQYLKSGDYKNATEEQLKDKWYNFDDLNFEFGTTKLTAASQRQVDNIIAILKEFPDAKIKLGAYTDKKGDDAANLKLSQERADAVKKALSAVASQIAGAEGYGEQFATVDENASDKEREADRKTAVRLAK